MKPYIGVDQIQPLPAITNESQGSNQLRGSRYLPAFTLFEIESKYQLFIVVTRNQVWRLQTLEYSGFVWLGCGRLH
jgi:hypothetical protein